jgi:hypothetical protein
MFMKVAGPLPKCGLGWVPAETGEMSSSGYGRGVLGGSGGGPDGWTETKGGGGGADRGALGGGE